MVHVNGTRDFSITGFGRVARIWLHALRWFGAWTPIVSPEIQVFPLLCQGGSHFHFFISTARG